SARRFLNESRIILGALGFISPPSPPETRTGRSRPGEAMSPGLICYQDHPASLFGQGVDSSWMRRVTGLRMSISGDTSTVRYVRRPSSTFLDLRLKQVESGIPSSVSA
ncbi:MAG: hypothetical protein ACE5JL_18010, partial [Dehalococcoidia bacterium]